MIVPALDWGFLGKQNNLIITAVFAEDRRSEENPNYFHSGIDLRAAEGTQLFCPWENCTIFKKGGKVTDKKGYGLHLTLKLNKVMTTMVGGTAKPDVDIFITFAHLSSISITKGIGESVARGELIALTGNSGHSDAAHLHLEIVKGAVKINPTSLLQKHKVDMKNLKPVYYGNILFAGVEINELKSLAGSVIQDAGDLTETEPPPKPPNIPSDATERLAPGIWQIVKLLIDSSVVQKQICDTSISAMDGSLMNWFNKICQQPLVEFMGETYGNQYVFIVRRPPFDREGMKRLYNDTLAVLDPQEIMGTNLGWNNQNIFSWYQLHPIQDLLGIKETNMFIPAIFFPEYAAIWGSKSLVVQSNYYNWMFSGRANHIWQMLRGLEEDEKKAAPKTKKVPKYGWVGDSWVEIGSEFQEIEDETENIEKKTLQEELEALSMENSNRILVNAIKDFQYLIECNAYSPFTRQGTITLLRNRKIKRGTMIMHTTGEVFHVDSVTHNWNISEGGVQETTTLNVSHGIFPEYIEDRAIDNFGVTKKYSYFNLIDWGEDFDVEKLDIEKYRNVIANWKVNVDTFGFFLSKKQLLKYYNPNEGNDNNIMDLPTGYDV